MQDFETHPQLTRDLHGLCQELAQRVYVYRDQLKRLNYLASKALFFHLSYIRVMTCLLHPNLQFTII